MCTCESSFSGNRSAQNTFTSESSSKNYKMNTTVTSSQQNSHPKRTEQQSFPIVIVLPSWPCLISAAMAPIQLQQPSFLTKLCTLQRRARQHSTLNTQQEALVTVDHGTQSRKTKSTNTNSMKRKFSLEMKTHTKIVVTSTQISHTTEDHTHCELH